VTKLLVADIGGTGSRLALMQDGRQVTTPVTYVNSEHESFEAVLENFLAGIDRPPGHAAFAVAGPVHRNSVQMTNLGWQLSAKHLSQHFGFSRVEIVNDFEALAWATLGLKATDVLQVGGGEILPLATRAILGPGTGLGVSGLVHHAGIWTVVAGEGGHVTMPAVSVEEAQLIEQVRQEFGHCSAERLVSGPGLARICAYLGGGNQTPENITRRALAGDIVALRTIEIFSLMLGTVASNLALTFGAQGGIYLAGGILPSIAELFATSGFRDRFEAKGRFSEYLALIPVYVITAAYPAFNGLELYMRRFAEGQSSA